MPSAQRFLATLFLFVAAQQGWAREQSYDVVVYGATGGGVAAAVQAARLGKSVALIEPSGHLGGMTSGGLGATDIGAKSSVTGLAREFYHRVWTHYKDPSAWKYETREEYLPKHHDAISENLKVQWFFEPKVAEKILNEMVREAKVNVFLGQQLKLDSKVAMDGNRIVSLTTEGGDVYRAKVFIDASYEGDLMAKAGVSYFVGREPNSQYGETLNGILPNKTVFTDGISPFKVAGDPSSGMLKGVEPEPPGQPGEGDRRVQAYTFRLCLTDVPENRMSISKPEDYDPELYELHLRYALANPGALLGEAYFKLTPMPNRKTDSNNKGSFSTDFVGRSFEWAEADQARRGQLWQEHASYLKGLLWFLGNDPRVPAGLRQEIGRWGLPKDEFEDTGHWPFQLYVREARRMRSDYVITENDCRRFNVAEDGIVLASYPMDSHFTSRYKDEQGRLRVEGGLLTKVAPYPVSYRAIVPKASECSNLLVPICLSATHAAYGSIRMEPVFMMLGQAAGVAAADAIARGSSVQAVSAEKLREQLETAGLIPEIKQESAPASSGAVSKSAEPFDLSDFKRAVVRLKELGVIEDEPYWIENVKPGKPLDGARVGDVLIKAANTLEPVDSLEAAMEVLASRKIVGNAKGYWTDNARVGKKCATGQVIGLFVRLSRAIN